MKKLFFGIIASLVLLSSCTIERLYCGEVTFKGEDSSGYFVEIFHDGWSYETFQVTRRTFNSTRVGEYACFN